MGITSKLHYFHTYKGMSLKWLLLFETHLVEILFHYNQFIFKMSICKLICIDCFHMYFTWSDAYWMIMVLSNYPHYNFQCCTLQPTSYHNPLEVQIPNIPSSIFINLFNSIKFLLYINIGFLLLQVLQNIAMTIHIETKTTYIKWFHFCEYDVTYIDIKPMTHFLYMIPIFYFS